VLTAIGNDFGYEQVFARQVTALGRRGDIFIAISTSGRSPNILKAVEAAKAAGVTTIAFTGNSNAPLAGACDLALRVPSAVTPLIQQVYLAAAHAICERVERALFGGART
jgi:D-sedoheptulose 7-phosphate isomerase